MRELVELFAFPLEELGLPYGLTGAVAATVYGRVRLTSDIDIVAALTRADADRLHAAFASEAFYVPPIEVIREEAARPSLGHFNLLHQESGLRADFYLAGDDEEKLDSIREARALSVSGRIVRVLGPEHVILNKLRFRKMGAGEKHVLDVRAMIETLGGALDRQRMEAMVRRSGLDRQWNEVLASPPED